MRKKLIIGMIVFLILLSISIIIVVYSNNKKASDGLEDFSDEKVEKNTINNKVDKDILNNNDHKVVINSTTKSKLNYTSSLSYTNNSFVSSETNVVINKVENNTIDKCVDENGNKICSLFTFSIKNTDTNSKDISVAMMPEGTDYESIQYRIYKGNENSTSRNNLIVDTTSMSLEDNSGINLSKLNVTLKPNNTITYTIMYWSNKDVDDFKASIVVNGEFCATTMPLKEIYGKSSDWQYSLNEDNTITLNKYIGNDTNLVVPNRIIDNEETYKVTKLEAEDVIYTKVSNYEFYNANGSNILGTTSNNTITSVKISDGVNIGAKAFYQFMALRNIEFGNYIEYINAKAFQGCTSLSGSVKLPEGLSFVGLQAFSGDQSISSLTIPLTLSTIDGNAFKYCKFNEVNFYSINATVNSVSLDDTRISPIFSESLSNATFNVGKLVQKIDTAMLYTSDIENLDLQNSISLNSIGKFAFYGCANLSNVIFNEGLETIGIGAFNNCSNLKTAIVLPSTLKYLSSKAFLSSGITGIKFNEGLLWIGDYAFDHCPSVNNKIVTIPSSVRQIGGTTYVGSNNIIGTHIFYDFAQSTLLSYEVAQGNENYMTIDGVLYSKINDKPQYIIGYPSKKTDLTYNMPESVIGNYELYFNRNKYVTTINLSDNYTIINDLPENWNNENREEGNNLGLGIYLYNNLANITVNSTNKKYKSVNGMLLSKDGSELEFIPLKNAGSGTITIPEGVVRTIKGSIYYASVSEHYSATKIVIPNTLTDIDSASFKALNLGVTNGTWQIEVSSDNIKYKVQTDGSIVLK